MDKNGTTFSFATTHSGTISPLHSLKHHPMKKDTEPERRFAYLKHSQQLVVAHRVVSVAVEREKRGQVDVVAVTGALGSGIIALKVRCRRVRESN